MTSLATYIPEEVVVLLGGFIPVEGFPPETFLYIFKDIPPNSSIRMPDGTMARLRNNDSTYTMELTIYSGSDSNDILTKFWQLDEITQRGKFPIFVKDNSGSSLFFSPTAWIESVPPLSFSNGLEVRTWIIRCAQGVINIGGNDGQSSTAEDLVNGILSAIPALQGAI